MTLPPPPRPVRLLTYGYAEIAAHTDEQIRAYAAQCVAAERERLAQYFDCSDTMIYRSEVAKVIRGE